jgi:hypothetical protein
VPLSVNARRVNSAQSPIATSSLSFFPPHGAQKVQRPPGGRPLVHARPVNTATAARQINVPPDGVFPRKMEERGKARK